MGVGNRLCHSIYIGTAYLHSQSELSFLGVKITIAGTFQQWREMPMISSYMPFGHASLLQVWALCPQLIFVELMLVCYLAYCLGVKFRLSSTCMMHFFVAFALKSAHI